MTRPLALAILSLTLGACAYSPGGSGVSNDVHTYLSTPHEPKTVSLIDTRTGQRIWTAEVPVGRQLVVKFMNNGNAEQSGVDEMRWDIMNYGRSWSTLSNIQPCPPASSRRLEWDLRKRPEMPAAASAN